MEPLGLDVNNNNNLRAASPCSQLKGSVIDETTRAPTPESNHRGDDICREEGSVGQADTKRRHGFTNVWLFELLCFLVSLGSLFIIIGVLKAYENNPLPKLPLHITLNTFLAFFTTSAKAAFMSPVVECISQWKWNWFRLERPITDFGVFDKASRGVVGSVFLLKLVKWRHMAVIGAVVSILGIVTTPVTQLLIQYPSHLVAVPSGPDTINATIPAVQHYRSRVGLAGPRSLDISSYVTAGLVHPSVSLIREVAPVCPSGTCTWAEFESLALCSKIANITDRIRVEQVPYSTSRDWTTWDDTLDNNPLRLNGTLAYNVSFPDEGDEYFVAPVSYTLYSSRLSRSIAFADDKALAAVWVGGYKVVWSNAGNVTYSGGNSTSSDPWKWQAFEMVYYACVNKYSVRVDNGTAQTVAVPSHNVIAPVGGGPGVVAINCTTPTLVTGGAQKTTCALAGRDPNQGLLTLKGSLPTTQGVNVNFTADVRSLTLLGQAITQDSSGIWAWDGGGFKVLVGNVATPTLADAVYGYKSDMTGDAPVGNQQLGAWDTEVQRQRLQNAATNLAVSITNGIRSINSGNDASTGSEKNDFPVLGTVLEMQVYVHVRWAWLTLLVAQLALALVFFVLTVLATRRLGSQVQVYKSSALATLFAIHPEDVPEMVRGRAQMVEQQGGMVLLLSSAHPPQEVNKTDDSDEKHAGGGVGKERAK